MLMADLRRDYVQTLFERMDDLEMFQLEDQYEKLEAEGRLALEASGIPTDRILFERAADMERDPERVLADVRSGYVSLEAARRDYGVVIRAEGRKFEIDLALTKELRCKSGTTGDL